jgi:predicted RNA-binding Zn-ribbon protein involved in translation (DUF1610 family)
MPKEEKETKVYTAIADALDSLASGLEEQLKLLNIQREDYDNLADEVNDLQESVYDLEEALSADSGEDYDDREAGGGDDEDGEESTESYISMTCPSCAYSFYYKYEEGRENEKLVCPSCGEEFSRSL